MGLLHRYREYKYISLLAFFVIGFVAGIFIMSMGKKVLLENTALLDEYSLYQMKYMTVDSNAFFLYVLKQRLGTVLIIALLASTYLGIVAVYAYSAWLGASFGMLMSASILRYGMKGILLVITAAFPQHLLYVPAFILLLKKAYELCAAIYFPSRCKEPHGMGIKAELRTYILKLITVFGVVIIGCLIESYVNPKIVTYLLKIF